MARKTGSREGNVPPQRVEETSDLLYVGRFGPVTLDYVDPSAAARFAEKRAQLEAIDPSLLRPVPREATVVQEGYGGRFRGRIALPGVDRELLDWQRYHPDGEATAGTGISRPLRVRLPDEIESTGMNSSVW